MLHKLVKFTLLCLNCSNFSDVFDEDHFIISLKNDVNVVKKLPKELASATKAVKNFRSWSGVDYYEEEIARLWDEYQVHKTNLCTKQAIMSICN